MKPPTALLVLVLALLLPASALGARPPTEAEQIAAVEAMKTSPAVMPAQGYTECRYALVLVSAVDPAWELGSVECYYPNGGGWDGAEVVLHNVHVVDIGTSGVGCGKAPDAVLTDLQLSTAPCHTEPAPTSHHHHECPAQEFGKLGHGSSILEVWIPQGHVSCSEAEKVMSALWHVYDHSKPSKAYRPIYRCYKGGTNCPHATSYEAIHGWKCYGQMGQGFCGRGRSKIRSTIISEP